MAVYRVIYEEFDGGSVARRNVRIDRYCTFAEMREFASAKFNSAGRKLIDVRHETWLEAAYRRTARITVRSLRIGIGAFIALAAYVFILASSPSIGDIPLSQLTLGEVFSALFRGAFFLAFLALGWWIAFGEGPSYAD